MRLNSKPSTYFLAILLCTMSFPVSGKATPDWKARNYERRIKPQPISFSERKVLRITRQWAKENNYFLRYAPRLGRVAHLILAKNAPHSELDSSKAKLFAHYWGMTDPEYAISRLTLLPTDNLKESINRHLSQTFSNFPYNRVGLAISKEKKHSTLLMVFSRHSLRLTPTPSRVKVKSRISLRGNFAPKKSLRAAQVVVSKPDGKIFKQKLKLKNKSFNHSIPTGSQPGVMDIQILVDRGSGPQVSAHFPIGVGHPPWSPPISPKRTQPKFSDQHPSEQLAALILEARKANGVRLLARSSSLDNIARNHAMDMIEGNFFAHTSPNTGNLSHRLSKADLLAERALENIAIGDNVHEIFKHWLQSPSHLKNMIDPHITTFGLGVERSPKTHHNSLTAVLILAKLGEAGSTDLLTQKAYSIINKTRTELGLKALKVDPSLENLALLHSQKMGKRKTLRTKFDNSEDLIKRIMQETTLQQSAANIYRTTTLTPLTESKHLRDSFAEVGIGIYQHSKSGATPLWVTVIYATP